MRNRTNELDGKTWLKYSFSIWRDIEKTDEEKKLGHPAMFPIQLTSRLIEIFTKPGDTVLDPFLGSGTTVISAYKLGRRGVGIDLSSDYIKLSKRRMKNFQNDLNIKKFVPIFFKDDIKNTSKILKKNSVNLVITSPPYWDILNQKRSADGKKIRNYGNYENDLGNIPQYEDFLRNLKESFFEVSKVLKSDGFFIVIVMDIRKKAVFYPFHLDVIKLMNENGLSLDDIIIWDRQKEYNNMRPLGYPYVFRINKVHEYILIFKK